MLSSVTDSMIRGANQVTACFCSRPAQNVLHREHSEALRILKEAPRYNEEKVLSLMLNELLSRSSCFDQSCVIKLLIQAVSDNKQLS